MNKILILLALLATLCLPTSVEAQGIGTWKNYLSYQDLDFVCPTGGNLVFAVANGNLFSYNTADGEVATYDKTNALSDVGITQAAWCREAQRLVVVYENGNIDFVDAKGNVVNLSDYYSYNTTIDKGIINLTIDGRYAYLCTNFGIVKIDVRNAAIAATYNLGLNVFDVCQNSKYFIASTDNGLQRAALADNLLDKAVWQKINVYRFYCTTTLGGKTVIITKGNINVLNPETGTTQAFYRTTLDKFLKTTDRVVCYGGSTTYIVTAPTADGVQAIDHKFTAIGYDPSDGTYWGNDEDGHLAHYAITANGDVTTLASGIHPDGPRYDKFGFMFYRNNHLYTTPNVEDADAAVQIYDNKAGTWNVYDNSFKATIGNRYLSSYALDVDPTDTSHVALATASGLYEFRSGKMVKHHNCNNSPLQGAATVSEKSYPNYTIVHALHFDAQGALWAFNTISATTSLLRLDTDGTWHSRHHKEFITSDGYSFSAAQCMGEDSRGRLWLTNANYLSPSLVCYFPSADSLKVYDTFANQDGTSYTITAFNCWAEDTEGNIWMGTDQGPFYLPAAQLSTDDETLTQVKVPRNDGTNQADYLLTGINITAMAFDGAGRKWFGTENNGIYVISKDNMTQEANFTQENSELLSNEITAIAIDGASGEVFIATSKGLCSYTTEAITPSEEMTKDNVYAYPNPVRPDYDGYITITGLSLDADVKIVNTAGHLITTGHSTGGTFLWDGCDSRGRRVASGVYMVETAKSDGSKGTVCKIGVVR